MKDDDFLFLFLLRSPRFLPFQQEHRLCYSDCRFTHTEGNVTRTFDFAALGPVGSLMYGPSFTSKGTKYFHQFNISLCGGQVRGWRGRRRRRRCTAELHIF